MVEEIEGKEALVTGTKQFVQQNEIDALQKSLSQTETMAEKLSWVPSNYWKVINQESELDDEITEKDVYEADLSDIEKKFDKDSVVYRIFQVLRKKGLRIFINPKTDISYTKGYNIIWWHWPITQQSRYTMEMPDDATDEEVYLTKLIHEMWHVIIWHTTRYNGEIIANFFNKILKLRKEWVSVTKIWDLDRYQNLTKVNEDSVELVRMYIQDPEKFEQHLWQILEWKDVQDVLYDCTKSCVESFLDKAENKEK